MSDQSSTLVRETSLEALRHIELGDAIILDGDHNHYTLTNELRLIDDRAERLPLRVLHDVGWPLARRDAYEAPDQIPEQHRQPLARGVGLAPGDAGVVAAGSTTRASLHGRVARETAS